MTTGPHVLVLPSWYPTWQEPVRGVFFREQARALQRAGVRVGVVYPELRRLRTLSDGEWTRNRFQATISEEDGVTTVRSHGWNVPHPRLRRHLFVQQARRLVDVYAEAVGEPDLLHAHSVLWAGVAAREIRTARRLPYLITEHSTAFARDLILPWQAEPMRCAYGHAERVLAVSRALADHMAPYVRPTEVTVVPNIIDPDVFTLPRRPRRSPPFTFLTVAALRPKKGIDVLLRAFRRAFPSDPAVRLRVAGGGELAEDLHELASELGLSERVAFAGQLSRDEVREALWTANAAVVPSRVETFGMVVIEAMATGLPVVATRSGGPEEIVTTDTGRLVEPDDVNGLAEALRWIRNREPELRERQEEIRAYAVRSFGRESVTRRLLEIYDSVPLRDDVGREAP